MAYVDNQKTRQYIEALAKTLTAEHPKMGVMFAGKCGNGKTTLLYAMQNAINYCKRHNMFLDIETIDWKVGMRIVDAREVVVLNQRAEDPKGRDAWNKLKHESMLAIEDMGKEPCEVMEYGNILNPVTELLEYRYDQQLFTAITTNLPPSVIRDKYGARIADRCNEMLDVIIFENDSYRK